MDRNAFERYLKMRRERPLGMKTAGDMASRCLRVQRAFAVDLDAVIAKNKLSALIERVKSAEGRKRLNYIGPDGHWYSSLVGALRSYAKFRATERLK